MTPSSPLKKAYISVRQTKVKDVEKFSFSSASFCLQFNISALF